MPADAEFCLLQDGHSCDIIKEIVPKKFKKKEASLKKKKENKLKKENLNKNILEN